ncbi:MAG: sugar phosphate isomerase/epimerase [Bacteroidota bacterium]|jgi:sugar phosphate isomerase/epimerase|nr:sugar phosphate isomerase/epimerase [Bacteroidota bacterium]
MPINRRKFISLSAVSGAAAMINKIDTFALPSQIIKANAGYKLLIFATNWGFSGNWEAFCSKIKEAGYDGAEVWFIADPLERKEFITAFQKYNLTFGLLVGGNDKDYKNHLLQFKSSLEGAVALKPVYINCHSGRDHFSFDQNRAFIDFSVDLASKSKVPVYHETHRSRILYSAPVARHFIEMIPDIRLTLDISHWCCVHESLLGDQQETISMVLNKTNHIHARIGHPEGPQVNDPRAPEWKDAVNAHLSWWDQVVNRKKQEGQLMTMLTEFGPVGYLPALPYTRLPVADQWEINKYMLELLKKRYS